MLIDGSEELTEEDIHLMEEISDLRAVVLLNKNDLDSKVSEQQIAAHSDKKIISFSTKTGSGREELERYIKEQFSLDHISFNDEVFVTNERQKQEICHSYESLEQVRESIDMKIGEDFYTIDLMEAYESLGKVIGQSVDDDLVNTVFTKFCMGK